ncbi:MAG: hypothetical protein KTR30_03380 [Saprospiraceae bacterium]|nr:hypothetical protein [Saprospiraceae bacterium]
MTKILRTGITLFIFPLALPLTAQKAITIVSEVWVEGEQQTVFNKLRSLEQFTDWSPFLVSDPEQKNWVEGVDGQIGSTFHWEGAAEKSEGFQTLAALKGQTYLRMECEISKPYKSQPVFEYELQEKDGKVQVVQTFTLKASGFNRFMMSLFGVKRKMKAINQLGMERLKMAIEEKNTALSQAW